MRRVQSTVDTIGIEAAPVRFLPRGRELIMSAVAVGIAFRGIGANKHGTEGWKTGGNDGNGSLNHGNGTGYHSLPAFRVVGSDDCITLSARSVCGI